MKTRSVVVDDFELEAFEVSETERQNQYSSGEQFKVQHVEDGSEYTAQISDDGSVIVTAAGGESQEFTAEEFEKQFVRVDDPAQEQATGTATESSGEGAEFLNRDDDNLPSRDADFKTDDPEKDMLKEKIARLEKLVGAQGAGAAAGSVPANSAGNAVSSLVSGAGAMIKGLVELTASSTAAAGAAASAGADKINALNAEYEVKGIQKSMDAIHESLDTIARDEMFKLNQKAVGDGVQTSESAMLYMKEKLDDPLNTHYSSFRFAYDDLMKNIAVLKEADIDLATGKLGKSVTLDKETQTDLLNSINTLKDRPELGLLPGSKEGESLNLDLEEILGKFLEFFQKLADRFTRSESGENQGTAPEPAAEPAPRA